MFGTDYANNRNILLTGATGFLGGHLMGAFLEGGSQVTALVRKNSDLGHLGREKVKIVYGDLKDKESLNSALKNVNTVIHSAALMSDSDHASKNYFFETNVSGIFLNLKYLRILRRIIKICLPSH